jgi:hypothetical protein
VKKEKISVRKVACFMSEKDFQKFDAAFKNSLCRNLSQYMRKMLLGKPVTIHSRNSSLDEFIEIAVKIRKDFSAIMTASSLTPNEKEELKEAIARIQSQLVKVVESCSQK